MCNYREPMPPTMTRPSVMPEEAKMKYESAKANYGRKVVPGTEEWKCWAGILRPLQERDVETLNCPVAAGTKESDGMVCCMPKYRIQKDYANRAGILRLQLERDVNVLNCRVSAKYFGPACCNANKLMIKSTVCKNA